MINSYFAEMVDRVVGPFLAEQGFSREEQFPSGVPYRRDRVVVTLAYRAADVVKPCVTVEVGTVADDGSLRSVGLWRAIPEGDPARDYSLWTFSDPGSLELLLHRLVEQVLPTYGPRLWDSADALRRVNAAAADEAEARYIEDRRRVDLLRARRAYDEGRLQDAIDGYVLLGPSALSAGDRRRLYEARKRLGAAANT